MFIMRHKWNISFAALYFVISLLLLAGCATSQVPVEDIGNNWVSRPLAELKQSMKDPDSYASKIHWKEKTYPLANGYYAFVEPIAPDCVIHWRINQRDIIVGYQAEGSGCKSEESESKTTNIWNLSPKKSSWDY
jgi:hypothetical protein